jgi:hypothetical protein
MPNFYEEMMQKMRIAFGVIVSILAGVPGLTVAQESGEPVSVPPATVPACVFPHPGATRIHARPTLVWTGVTGAPGYLIECSPDSLFTHDVVRDTTGDETVARVASLLPHDTGIYWRVAVRDSLGSPVWSAPSFFVTAPPPNASPVAFPLTRRNDSSDVSVWLRIPVRSVVEITAARCTGSSLAIASPLPWITTARDSIPLHVQFRPRRFGETRDTVMISTDLGECLVPVWGSSPPPVLRAATAELPLGAIAATDTTSARVVLRNVTAINDAAVSKIRTRTSFFSVLPRSPRYVAPGDSCVVAIRFHPRPSKGDLFGHFADTLLVEYDGGVERIVLQGDSPPPRPVANIDVLDFGTVAAQDTGTAVVRVANASLNALRIDSIRTRLRTFTPLQKRAVVKAFDTLDVAVRFVPTRHGTYNDTLVLFNNSWRSPLRVPVLATVPFPRPEANLTQVDFGNVTVGDTARAVVHIGNASVSYLRVDSIRTRFRRFRLSVPPLPTVLMEGDSLKIGILFRPDSLRGFTDTLVLVTNAAERVMRIPIGGTGTAAPYGWNKGVNSRNFELFQNFPNPFNSTTTFRYFLPVPSHVRLEVFSTIGQSIAVVVDGVKSTGHHDVTWQTDLPSGMYYCRLSATPFEDPGKTFIGTRKLVVVR